MPKSRTRKGAKKHTFTQKVKVLREVDSQYGKFRAWTGEFKQINHNKNQYNEPQSIEETAQGRKEEQKDLSAAEERLQAGEGANTGADS